MRTVFLLLITVLMTAQPAQAAGLKTHVIADDPLLTLGDLFEDAGDAAHIVVARAPAPGERLMLSAVRISAVANRHGLTVPSGVNRVSVERPGRPVGIEELTDLVGEKLSVYGEEAEGRVELSGSYSALFMPIETVDSPVLGNFTYDSRSKRFAGRIDIKDIDGQITSTRLSGRVVPVVSVPVLRTAVAPGDIISAQNIGWIEISARNASRNLVMTREQIVGMSPRRTLRPGVTIRTNDVSRPIAVAKGALVTMSIRHRYMQLTATGRSLDNGSLGDVIRIVNPKSHVTVQGVIVGENQVRIDYAEAPSAQRLSSLR